MYMWGGHGKGDLYGWNVKIKFLWCFTLKNVIFTFQPYRSLSHAPWHISLCVWSSVAATKVVVGEQTHTHTGTYGNDAEPAANTLERLFTGDVVDNDKCICSPEVDWRQGIVEPLGEQTDSGSVSVGECVQHRSCVRIVSVIEYTDHVLDF